MQLVSSGLRGSGDSAVMRTLTYNHRSLGLIHRVGLLPPQKPTFQITIRPGNSGQEEPHECAMLNYHFNFRYYDFREIHSLAVDAHVRFTMIPQAPNTISNMIRITKMILVL